MLFQLLNSFILSLRIWSSITKKVLIKNVFKTFEVYIMSLSENNLNSDIVWKRTPKLIALNTIRLEPNLLQKLKFLLKSKNKQLFKYYSFILFRYTTLQSNSNLTKKLYKRIQKIIPLSEGFLFEKVTNGIQK